MRNDARGPLCPSAQPSMEEVVVLGVVDRTDQEPRVGYLAEDRPVTAEVLGLAGEVSPTEIFRFAAPCAGRSCRHFDGADCRLATRVVALLSPVVQGVPPCPIRSDCRWWQQEGKAACLRCPQIVTETYDPPEMIRRAAEPAVPGPGPRAHPTA